MKIKVFRSSNLPVVVYECVTWSVTLREEHGLRVFENRVQRRVFGSNREQIRGGWRELCDEELRDHHQILLR
jgi:hypothetical protein